RPAYATAAPWLPVLAATTSPTSRRARFTRSECTAPRTLNEPVGSSCSSFRYSSRPGALSDAARTSRVGPNVDSVIGGADLIAGRLPVSQTVCDPEVAEVVARAKAASRSLCSLIDKLSISKQLGRQPAFLLPARQSD